MPNAHKVHFVYLIPTDKTNNAQGAITRAALHIQSWYRWQMNTGPDPTMANKTFTLDDPIVSVYNSTHDSAWYPTNVVGEDPSGYFWANTLQDAADLAGAGFYQEFDDWVVYVDSDPAAGQGTGGTSGGYTSGVCVLHGGDLRGLRGVHPYWTLCRSIGGSAHEFGHSIGLPHPDPPTGHDWWHGVMGMGFETYSDAHLTDADKEYLNTHPFFEAADRGIPVPAGLCPFDSVRQRPYPRRRPTMTNA